MDLTQLSATELSRMLRDREVRSTEVTAAVLDRIERVDAVVGAFITVTAELAMAEAEAADARLDKGEPISRMDGIPYSIKDLEPTAGIRTTYGSKFFENNVPDEDSAVAGILRRSGGVLLGKTNTPHYGYKGAADNYVARTTVNPWDTTKTPGGSSGGAAAAVAAGLGPLAQGGDGAGSIRVPAAFCGVVGFKGSFGRVPLFPAKNPWTSRVHNGPITRSVADAELMFRVMAQPDERDPWSLSTPLAPYEPPTGDRPLAGTRALFSLDFGYGVVGAAVEAPVRRAVALLRELGCEVVEGDPEWTDPGGFHSVMYAGGGMPAPFREHPEWVEADFYALLEAGGKRTPDEIAWAEAARGDFYQAAMATMRSYDFMVTPTMPLEAWSATPGTAPTTVDGRTVDPKQSVGFLVYPFNLTNQPAISLPVGLTEGGLPAGIQIVGRRHEDMRVLGAAAALEAVLDLPEWPNPTVRPEGIDAVIPS
jgi:Asp-tRNA(Asn)/Glu-tRNA(Gln) amidotransferase A subunit family amidase